MKRILCLLLVVVAVVCVGCGGSKSETQNDTGQVIVFGLLPDVDSFPFVVAAEKGYFADEGVKVELQSFKSAMDRDAALQSGNLDGAVSDMLAAAFAQDGGFAVKMTSSTDGNYVLLTAPDKNFSSVDELAGQEVAVSRNTIIEYVTDQILARENMADNSIKKVVIPQIPVRLEMLQNGKLTAATLPEPMASVALDGGCRKIADASQLNINPGVVLFTEKSLNGKKKEIAALYRAYNKAVAYLNDAPPDEYIKLAIDKGGFPPAVKSSLTLQHYRTAVMPRESDVTACLEWMTRKNLIKQSYTYEGLTEDVLPAAKS